VCAGDRTDVFAQARDAEYVTSTTDWEYRRCQTCDLVFLSEPPVDRLAEIYPPNYYSYGSESGRSLVYRIKERMDRRVFRRFLAPMRGDLRVLDVGGGSGHLLTLARDASTSVVETHEVDISEDARARAEADGHVFHNTRIEDFTPHGTFDLVIMLNLIEHVADPRAVLHAVHGLLSDQGRLIVKTPNTDTLDCRLFRRHNWGGFHCPRHFVLFTKPGLVALAEDCGFAVDDLSYTQGAPQWAASVLGVMATRGWADITAERPMHLHPLYTPLLALFGLVDFVRRPFAPTAQMFGIFSKG
jgi:SAM-dependent methyltransferase